MSMMQDNLFATTSRSARPISPLDTVHADIEQLAVEAKRVVIWQSVLNAIHEHGKSAPHIEVCGVIVGDVVDEGDGAAVFVTNHIEGQGTQATAGSVTFTAETWTHIHQQMDQRFPDQRIVGWYHTHPGFGIFLSPMDMFICENFFDLPWQIALVHDPVNLEQGVFTWKDGKVERSEFEIEENAAPRGRRRPDHDEHRQHVMIVWVMLAVVVLAMTAVAFTWAQVEPVDVYESASPAATHDAPDDPGGGK